jgi:hypothetical protein
MGRNVEQLSPTAHRQEPERLRQSFYNRLVATLERDLTARIFRKIHYHSLRVTLRVFAPSREIVRGLRDSYRAAFHDRNCRTTMGRNVEQLSPTAHRQEPERLRQSFYNRLVATLEQDHSQDL